MASPAHQWQVILCEVRPDELLLAILAFKCSSRPHLPLCPRILGHAMVQAKNCIQIAAGSLVLGPGLPRVLEGSHRHCKVAEDFEIAHGVTFAAN